MADLDAVLEQLKQERRRAEGELKQLGKVITALSKIKMKTRGSGSGTVKHQLSAAARERIAAAQRARWAKVRAQSRKAS